MIIIECIILCVLFTGMVYRSGSMNYYFTFYSTFGINSKIGAKDTFEIELDSNVDAIYFYAGDKGYKQVLQKDEGIGEWLVKD